MNNTWQQEMSGKIEMCPLGLFIQEHNNNVLQLVTGN